MTEISLTQEIKGFFIPSIVKKERDQVNMHYDILPLTSGFATGFIASKGVNVSPTDFPLYFPTLLIGLITPAALLSGKWLTKKIPPIMMNLEHRSKMEENLSNKKIISTTIKNCARTAYQTGLGYYAGYFTGKLLE